MRGLIFTELLTMAEATMGEDAVDDILDELPLSTDGAYTSVGNYPGAEFLAIVSAICLKTGAIIDDYLQRFGSWMMSRMSQTHKTFFADKDDALEALEAVDGELKAEVHKLYPDEIVPNLNTKRIDENAIEMTYHSDRSFSAFLLGMVQGCVDFFGQTAEVTAIELAGGSPGNAAFQVRLKG